MEKLNNNIDEKVFYNFSDFESHINKIFLDYDKKIIKNIISDLSIMDKNANIHKDKKGNIIYDADSKDVEMVSFKEDIKDYMKREVLPYIPDAKAFFDENLTLKTPVIRTGATIPFNRYFYKYEFLDSTKDIINELKSNDIIVRKLMDNLFEENLND
jgi:type I restriction enzyme M protein